MFYCLGRFWQSGIRSPSAPPPRAMHNKENNKMNKNKYNKRTIDETIKVYARNQCSILQPGQQVKSSFIYTITATSFLSIAHENIRKSESFLMFSGDIDKQHRTAMGKI